MDATPKQLTINEGMVWLKTLRERHAELVSMRNENSAEITRRYGVGGDREVTKTPTYDVKVLDKMITRVAREIRVLDQQIKATNGVTPIKDYTQDDSVLGELS
jgi:hypothetical protein